MSTRIAIILALIALGAIAQMGHMGTGRPLPKTIPSAENPITPEKVALGRMLYYDARLSKDNTVSCNSCHDLAKYGVDGAQFSRGVGGQLGGRNSPTVYHAASQALQFWDGRARTVEDQAKGPVLNPVEMAMASAAEVEARLQAIPGYVKAFQAAFPKQKRPVTFDNAALAIGAFERGLITHSSPWDRYLAGDESALSEQARLGRHEFMHNGCASCHNGPFIGGRSLQKLGAEKAWPVTKDPGRYEVTRQETDRMIFKVPTLRNVAMTAPYFHDGSVKELPEAIRLMGKHQLAVDLSPQQIDRIAAWLRALTGEIPRDYIQKPELP